MNNLVLRVVEFQVHDTVIQVLFEGTIKSGRNPV